MQKLYQPYIFHLPDGTVEQRIYIGDDIVTTEKELQQMQVNDQRQFRTCELFDPRRFPKWF